MNLPGCVWVLETVICLSIRGGSITPVAGSLQVAVTRHRCITRQFHSMFSWQIGSRPQLTGEEAGKLSSATCPSSLVATVRRDEARTSRKQWLDPCLSFPDHNWHLSPNRGNCVQIVPQSVWTPTLFNWMKRQERDFPNSTKEFSIWDST